MDAGEGLIGKALRDEELYDRMADVATRLQAVMGRLESERGPLGRLMNDQDMSRNLAKSAAGIESVISRIESGQGPLGALSKDDKLVADLKGVTSSLSAVAQRLERGEGSLGKMMTDDTLYRRLDTLSQRLDTLATPHGERGGQSREAPEGPRVLRQPQRRGQRRAHADRRRPQRSEQVLAGAIEGVLIYLSEPAPLIKR